MYCKYSDGSAVTLVQARYARTDPQVLETYHVPLTDLNGAIPLGLDWQTWTISGVIADPLSVRWRDIVLLSLDNVSWRVCRYQTIAFPTNLLQQSLYELTMLVSPVLEGAAVRYPTTGYKWGNQSITGISQAGNVNAFPTIHFLAPLFYAPLSNTLIDFAGQSVTFTRTASKVHGGVTYPINTPIFDAGLYLASDTAQDVATWIPPASTLRTIAMQLKQTRSISTGTNLIANGEFEANTTGWSGDGTITRDTATPLVGVGSLKCVATTAQYAYSLVTLIVGHVYYAQGLLKSTAAAGRKASVTLGVATGPLRDCSVLNAVSTILVASTTSEGLLFCLDSTVAGESFLIDSVLCYDLTVLFGGNILTVWTAAHNKLTIDIADGLLKWTDDTTTVQTGFPVSAYLSGAVTDIVLLDDTSHAVIVTVCAAGGSWVGATGTLAAIAYPQLTLGNLEGSIANLIEFPYVLTSAEYQAIAYSSLSLLYNTLYIGNKYAEEIVKGADSRLENAAGADISALLGGSDIAIGSAAVTIAQSQGLSARWYVEVQRTDV